MSKYHSALRNTELHPVGSTASTQPATGLVKGLAWIDSDGKLWIYSGSTFRGVVMSGDAIAGYIPTSAKGAASGVAELDSNGYVPSAQLPAYVDDVLEYDLLANFPGTGSTGKIYVDTTTRLCYRWSGSAYVEISPSLALGETSSTAYRGDRGKTAYDHSQVTSGNPHAVSKADVGLGNLTNDAQVKKPGSATAGNLAVFGSDPSLIVDGGPVPGGSGATAFTSLTDTFASYSGKGLYGLRINSATTAIEAYAQANPIVLPIPRGQASLLPVIQHTQGVAARTPGSFLACTGGSGPICCCTDGTTLFVMLRLANAVAKYTVSSMVQSGADLALPAGYTPQRIYAFGGQLYVVIMHNSTYVSYLQRITIATWTLNGSPLQLHGGAACGYNGTLCIAGNGNDHLIITAGDTASYVTIVQMSTFTVAGVGNSGYGWTGGAVWDALLPRFVTGTTGGISEWSAAGVETYHSLGHSDRYMDVAHDGMGYLWASRYGSNGIDVIDTTTWTIATTISSSQANHVIPDSRGAVWINTGGTLSRAMVWSQSIDFTNRMLPSMDLGARFCEHTGFLWIPEYGDARVRRIPLAGGNL